MTSCNICGGVNCGCVIQAVTVVTNTVGPIQVTNTSGGARGAQGAVGPQGIQGVQVTTGIQGMLGIQGAIGLQGIQGAQGIQGRQIGRAHV